VDPGTGPDMTSKRKVPSPFRDSNTDNLARSQSLYRLSYPGSYSESEVYSTNTVTEQCKKVKGKVIPVL
jgi:hypothetical protein